MAETDQNVGLDGRPVFAGDTLAIDFSIETGGTAAGVSAAEWGLFDRQPSAEVVGQEPLLSKTLGNGIAVVDGSPEGVVVVTIGVTEGESLNSTAKESRPPFLKRLVLCFRPSMCCWISSKTDSSRLSPSRFCVRVVKSRTW